jgi:hypothetical protein
LSSCLSALIRISESIWIAALKCQSLFVGSDCFFTFVGLLRIDLQALLKTTLHEVGAEEMSLYMVFLMNTRWKPASSLREVC